MHGECNCSLSLQTCAFIRPLSGAFVIYQVHAGEPRSGGTTGGLRYVSSGGSGVLV